MLGQDVHKELPERLQLNADVSKQLQTIEDLSRIRAAQGDPVVSPPAECAANGAQRKHSQQAIERAQLRLFEFHRIAARALPPYPKRMRQPIGPIPAWTTHVPTPSRLIAALARM
jgi:hypothetical protein